VSAGIAARYHRNGYVVIPAVVEPARVTGCVEHLRFLQDRHAPGPIVTAPVAGDPFLAEMAGDPNLSAIARALLEGEPVPFGCTYFVKEPRQGPPARWHQDGYPWRIQLGITEAVTLWVALDRADEETGGLRVIPGSHALAAQPLIRGPAEGNVFGWEIAPHLVEPGLAQNLTLAAGDVSAHHPNLIHGSGPNRSGYLRRALAIRYRPA
jgi:ectoine hydroxylase-related dioxygenase (phytanoyl-CoA dioxygenase family)